MDKERTCVLLELNNMQMKISTLFQDLLKEKNDYKQNSENLTKQLERVSNEVKNLKNEAENLKKQKEALKQSSDEIKDIIDEGIRVLKALNFSNMQYEHKTALVSLKKVFLRISQQLQHSKTVEATLKGKDKIDVIDKEQIKFSDTESQKKLEPLNKVNFFTDCYCNEDDQNSPKNQIDVLGKINPDVVQKTSFQSTHEVIKTLKIPSSSSYSETIVSDSILKPVSPSPKNENHLTRSPVFKDFGLRKHDSLSSEENSNKSSTSLKLINEKFLERPSGFIISPWKKPPYGTSEKSPSTPKRVKKKLKINSPDRSPLSILKKSYTREAEITFSGIRKLRQTFLNLDCYKKKISVKDLENRENENSENDANKSEDKKLVDDMEDDDLIIESPERTDHVLEDLKNKKSKQELNEVPFITPPQTSDLTLDETYISASVIQKCNFTKKRALESPVKDQTPLKRPTREKSPEYDSVPFVYKREPVRKKKERMKLPGHVCAECNKYYENAFEHIDAQDLKTILNKCSRHRDKNSPGLDDTPPGYWKPYLTCSTIISPSKTEAS